jgi:AraC-like DNA-binding protein
MPRPRRRRSHALEYWYRVSPIALTPISPSIQTNMRFVGFLPRQSAEHIQRILRRTGPEFVTSFDELSEIFRKEAVDAALIDPQANGDNTDAFLGIIRSHPRARFIAYVQRTPAALHAILRLSQHGVEDVFVHPEKADNPRFVNTIRRIEADSLAAELLSTAETKLQALDPPLLAAVIDLFHRPYCYAFANDLADQAGISIRSLYRALEKADFATARQLLNVAKMVHAYSYLRHSPTTIRAVSSQLGYRRPEALSNAMLTHLGIRTVGFDRMMKPNQALLHLIEALRKASMRRPALRDRLGRGDLL